MNVIEYYTVTYACEECEKESGYAHIYSTQAPPPLLKHSLASASTVADVMTRKYVDGLPLYRQEKIWEREGVALSRATMANWVIQTAQTWLKPLYRRLKKHLLESRVIYADETVVMKTPFGPLWLDEKTGLFSDTRKGAASSAIVYTLVETAKANGLNPHTYLLRLLEELPYLGRDPSPNDLDVFLPWQPTVQAAYAISVSPKTSGDL